MKHFEELLLTLGGREPTLIEENENWALWNVVFPTPASSVRASYLHLKFKCPLKEATEQTISNWSKKSPSGKYEIIVSPQHSLARDLNNTARVFRATNARTSHSLLFDNLLASLEFRPADIEEFFVDPSLLVTGKNESVSATKYLSNWLIGNQNVQDGMNACLGVVRAHGGIGKTTLCRMVCNNVQKLSKTALPILIESSQWQAHLRPNLQMRDIWDIAISRTFAVPSRLLSNEMALRVLIREGIFIPILDGFDELCLSPSSDHGAEEIIQQLLEMIEDEDGASNARILLTSRETFWNALEGKVETKSLEVFSLLGFSTAQKQDYFRKRLASPEEQQVALRLAKEISGRIYEKIEIEGQNAERPEGVPFILDMIASYVHENPDPAAINPYLTDSLAPLLEAMCRRENTRQKLGISHETQLVLFEELFREFPESFGQTDLNEHLEIICDVRDHAVWQRFQSHVFLRRLADGSYAAKYEVLRIYFIASFLAKSLCDLTIGHRKKVAAILAKHSSGSSEVIDWLVGQMKSLSRERLSAAIRHAKQIISDPDNAREFRLAGAAFANVIMRLISGDDKKARIADLLSFVAEPNSSVIEHSVFAGAIRAFDLQEVKFVNCCFQNADFRNCVFGQNTHFIDCDFLGTLEVHSCEGLDLANLNGGRLSGHAELFFDSVMHKKSRPETRRVFAEEVLSAALRKFRGAFGFSSIQFRRRMGGLPVSNPFTNRIWDALMQRGVVQKHHISNVAEGGLNIVDVPDIRREVRGFIDNGVIGVQLRRVVDDLINEE